MARNLMSPERSISAVTDPTVVGLITAIVASAERCADDVAGLVSIWRRTVPGFEHRPLTVSALLKLGALVELARWERGRLTQYLRTPVPPASTVLADAITPANDGCIERFDGILLARQVFTIRFSELAWEPMSARGDVVVTTIKPDDLLDELASFLWRHRHLATGNKKE